MLLCVGSMRLGRETGQGARSRGDRVNECCHSDERSLAGERAIAKIRTLYADSVQAASSGHSGTPITMAPAACTLWQELLQAEATDGGSQVP